MDYDKIEREVLKKDLIEIGINTLGEIVAEKANSFSRLGNAASKASTEGRSHEGSSTCAIQCNHYRVKPW